LSEAVLKQGDRLVATARNVSVLADLASFATSDRDQLITVKLDVTKQEDIDEAFAQAVKHFGRVDVVVNNAGYSLMGEFESTSDEQIRDELDVNLWGVLRVSRAAIKVFREVNNKSKPNSGGHLIQISSVAGFVPAPGMSIYHTRCLHLTSHSRAST
jgi:NAD(P)-dependent dehydrogenase (short-subunit alcohol dehydrogenase family)